MSSTETSPTTSTSRSLIVNEIYGPIWQGEGRQTGQRAAFIRLGTCNLHCNFCDTPYTWAFDERHAAMHRDGVQYDPRQELRRMRWDEVYDAVDELGLGLNTLLIFSGGEPLLQQEGLIPLVTALHHRYRIAFETAGTILPVRWPFVQWTVSPKLANSGNEAKLRYKPNVLRQFQQLGADFKFVVKDVDDLVEVSNIVADINILPDQVWIMPEGTTPQGQLATARYLADGIHKYGWNLSLRQHVLLYGQERGR